MREHVDLPTVDALDEEWRQHPPVHHLVAAYLDYRPREQTSAQPVTDIEDILPALGDVPIRQVPAIDSSAFDAHFATSREPEHGGQ